MSIERAARLLAIAHVSALLSMMSLNAQTITHTVYAAADWANPVSGVPLSSSCGGSRSDTMSSNNVCQCLREVQYSPGGGSARYGLEHVWQFDNVPPGAQYLLWEGYRDGENFAFSYNTAPTPTGTCSATVFVAVPGAAIDNLNDASCGTSGPLGFALKLLDTTAVATRLCVLLKDSNRTGCPVDQFQDQVRIDHLAIVTRPLYTSPESACTDGLDNDADTFTDCADTDCQSACFIELVCDNCVDDDSDGATDCTDLDCSGTPVCGGWTP